MKSPAWLVKNMLCTKCHECGRMLRHIFRVRCSFHQEDVTMLRRIPLFCVFGLTVASAQATMLLSGGINSTDGGGMEATAAWDNGGAVLNWSVLQLQNGLWQYDYDFNVGKKELSHIDFQVSGNFTVENIYSGTTEGWELGLWGNEGGSSPGIPGSIYGLKFDGGGLLNSFTIVSDRAPMWGDFYAKDGKDGGDWVYAYNTNFGVGGDLYQDYAFGKILVPDTHTLPPPPVVVPEPASIVLLGSGIVAMAMVRRRKIVST